MGGLLTTVAHPPAVTTGSFSRPRTRESRLRELAPLLQRRILVLDGAMGTMIQSYQLGEQDYRGERFADWHNRTSRATTTCSR